MVSYSRSLQIFTLGNVIKPQRIIWSGSATQALPTAFNTNYSSIDLCSVQNETITATAYYTLSNGVVITHSDDIRITFDPSYPQAKDFVKPVCNSQQIFLSSRS